MARRWVLISLCTLACDGGERSKGGGASGGGASGGGASGGGGTAAIAGDAGETSSGGSNAGAGAPSGGSSSGGAATGGSSGASGAGSDGKAGSGGPSGGASGSGASGGAGGSAAAPTTEPLACLKSVAVGYDYLCVVNGTGRVLCWGAAGTLGNGTELDSATPVFVHALDAPAVAVYGGYGDNFAFLENDKTFRWGRVRTVSRMYSWPTPQDATSFLPSASTVIDGGIHHCTLQEDWTVSCWGANSSGQLGTGDGQHSDDPVPVPGLDSVRALAVGYYHNCAVKDDGTLWCWGGNERGQLGLGTFEDANVPTQLTALGTRVTHVASRHEYTCAVLDDGTVSCWGREGYADLEGNPNPTAIAGLEDVESTALGRFHVCALKTDDSLWCWNQGGASASDIPVPSRTPAPIAELGNDVEAVMTGYESTCVFRKDGSLHCFGSDLGLTVTPTEIAPGCN